METYSFDWNQTVADFVRVAIAFLLALPIGWERVRGERSIGLRTFPIVAMASCGYVLVVRSLPGINTEAEARVVQGLLAGIGFIGGGAILKRDVDIHGLATAASIWNTGAIGAAVAFHREEIAVVLSLINFLVLYFLTPVAKRYKIIVKDNTIDVGEGKDAE